MESALSGPFIYQIQAEASQRPSSPLTRYPSAPRSTAAAVGHLNEFYANRLILRSPEKQAQFGADPRFRLIAEHGPLATYELADLETKLIEVAPELDPSVIERYRKPASERVKVTLQRETTRTTEVRPVRTQAPASANSFYF